MNDTTSTRATPFPSGFVWGTATAAYQIEGAAAEDGRTPSVWDTFSHTPGRTLHGDTGDVACDHYHRWEEDLDLVTGLGTDAYRFSLAWPRLLPGGTGKVNPRGIAFYDRLLDGMLERGIRPMATLFHWDLPQVLEDRGGWRNRDCAEWFAQYAEAAFDAFGDRVEWWITHNEPICPSFHGTAGGHAAPGLRMGHEAIAAAHHLLLGHARAVEAFRARAPRGAGIGITLNFGPVTPADGASPEDVTAAARIDALQTRWFADPLFGAGYPAELADFYRDISDFSFVRDGDLAAIARPLDFLGVNYYKSWVGRAAELPPAGKRTATDLGVALAPPPGSETTGFGWAVCPDGLRDLLVELTARYPRLPALYVTENGCAYDDYVSPDGAVHDPERVSFLRRYTDAAAEAIAAGVDLRGYFAWSLLDNFEWAAGYSKRFGLVHVDYGTGHRTPKDSYHWYRDRIAAARR